MEKLACNGQVEEGGHVSAFMSVGEETKILDDNGSSFQIGDHADDQEGLTISEEDVESVKHVNWFVRKYYPWLALTAGFIYGTQAFVQSFLLDENQKDFSFALFMP